MVAIGSITGNWTPGRGTVTEWTASSSSRELAAAAPIDPLPPTFQQEQHLRTAHSARQLRRESARLILTSWHVGGWCDIAAMTDAINAHLRRHDTYHSAFDVTDTEIGVSCRVLACLEAVTIMICSSPASSAAAVCA